MVACKKCGDENTARLEVCEVCGSLCDDPRPRYTGAQRGQAEAEKYTGKPIRATSALVISILLMVVVLPIGIVPFIFALLGVIAKNNRDYQKAWRYVCIANWIHAITFALILLGAAGVLLYTVGVFS